MLSTIKNIYIEEQPCARITNFVLLFDCFTLTKKNTLSYPFSKLAGNLQIPSAVNELTESFTNDFREGYDINLGVGYVNDKTIPTKAITKALKYIIRHPEKYRSSFNYGSAQGSPNLINSIKNYYLRNNIGGLNEEDLNRKTLIIGANGATSLLDAFSDIMGPGIVITADPYYYIYTESLINKGYKIEPVKEDNNGIIPKAIIEKLNQINAEEISFFYIVTVNNPSSVVLSNQRKSEIVKIAATISKKTGRKIPVIFDKAYEDIIHNGDIEKPISGMKYAPNDMVYEVGTLSKIIAPALRIGYMFCPDNKMAKLLIQRTSDIGFSSSLINQEIASWLLDNYIQIQQKKVNGGYREKAKYLRNLIDQKLGPYLDCYTGGDAAFYFYLTFKNIETGKNSDFYKFLSRTTGDLETDGNPNKLERLIYIPGEICSQEEKARFQIRISYGFEENDTFKRAISLLKQACEYSVKINPDK